MGLSSIALAGQGLPVGGVKRLLQRGVVQRFRADGHAGLVGVLLFGAPIRRHWSIGRVQGLLQLGDAGQVELPLFVLCQGNVKAICKLGFLAALGLLHGVPEGGAVLVLGGGLGRQENVCADHAALASEVVGLPIILAGKVQPGRRCTFPARAQGLPRSGARGAAPCAERSDANGPDFRKSGP